MRIFALETDASKIKEQFCHEGECVKLHTYYHGLSFLFAILREIFITVIAVIAVAVAISYGAPVWWTIGLAGAIWSFLVIFNVLKAYID